MPVWIDKGANGGIRLGIQFLHLIPVHQEGPSKIGTGMEDKFVRIVLREAVTVEAVSSAEPVVYDGVLGITLDMALINPHPVPALIPGRDEAV
jgi:hypothetical protein